MACAQETVTVDAAAKTTPFPHFWEQTFGSGRAILELRDDYRKDLRTVKAATGFQSIRFHGIFNDEVGLYDPDRKTKNPGLAAQAANDASVYNFTYVDQIYDSLLENGVQPFVEMSFMPKKMAADPNMLHPFWYHPDVSPPKDYAAWDAMIKAFAQHLIDRYGMDEVAKWKFEVWNEPNLDFWGGRPNQPTYFELYDHTARALKSVSPRIQVGGPATAQAAWVTPFLAHVKAENVPVDFVSTHVYANDRAQDVFHTDENIPRDVMVYRSVKKVHEEIEHSAYPHLPLIFSEYNASYANEPNVTDSTYMGPWLANNIRLCDGLTESMSYWSFSDVFEEQGVPRTPFYGGFGLIATDHIEKPVFHVFEILHRLGDERIKVESDSALATKSPDGKVEVALWDYAPPTGTGANYTMPSGPAGPVKVFDLHVEHVAENAPVEVLRVDDDHGNVLKAFDAMGRPQGSLTHEQVMKLRAAAAMAPPEHLRLDHGKLQVTVPAHGLAVLIVGR
ncbi:glycosyl hydrolase family 39 [Granulicella sp. 5B5]|uniref:GH39 family glycosyl hydrolase n=1 Tax=Granulicella sp. 5B5 TaxID=1617967 RepID=UPI00210447CB|nr:glycosyl hydrolase family 39 [Granulicella sp. 5B5]